MPILGFAADRTERSVDFPALGKPTKPTSASTFNSNIFKFVRQGEVLSIGTLHGVDAEILEFEVKAGSKVTKAPIRKLNFPSTAIIGGVVRANSSYTPLGNFRIQAGDRVVVFTMPESIHKVERFFIK